MKTNIVSEDKVEKGHRVFTLRLVAAILLFNVVVCGFAYWMLAVSRTESEQRAKVNTENIVNLLEQHVTSLFEKADIILRLSQDEVMRQISMGPIDTAHLGWVFHELLHSSPELGELCVTGMKNFEQWNCHALKDTFVQTTLDGEKVDMRHESTRFMVIASPTFSRNTNKKEMHLYRRYNLPDGRYGGVVGMAIDMSIFNLNFSAINLGENGKIIMLDEGQGVFAQYPDTYGEEEIGNSDWWESMGFSKIYQRMLKTNPYKGTYMTSSQYGGSSILASYQKTGNWPLFVHVSFPKDEYLSEWRHDLKAGIMLVALISFLSILFGVLFQRYWITRRRMLHALLENENMYRSFAEMATDWFWEQDENFLFTRMAGSLLKTYRTDPGHFIGKTRWDIAVDVPEEKMASHKALVKRHLPFKDFEYSFFNVDGEKRTISASGGPLFDEEGNFKGYRGTGKDVTDRRLYEESIERLAQYDNLTGLPNRMLFDSRVEMAMSLARREGKKLALMYFDLDKFKPVNDNYGHHAGDNLLRQVAERVSLEVRDSDTVARLGGDEFAILQMNVANYEDAEEVAGRVIASLSAPFAVAGVEEEVRIGVSIGIALFPEDGNNKHRLIKASDMAMYEAKKVRNCYRLYASLEYSGANNNKKEKINEA